MADKDITTRINGTTSLPIITITSNGTANGSVIDMFGYDAINFDFLSGNAIGADVTVTMEHDDDAGFATAVAVPSKFIIGELPSFLIAGAETNTVKSVGYVGKKRYVRVSITSANYAADTQIAGIANRGDARVNPV